LRFGERLPNPFADEGDLTLWFHPLCAAYKRPESVLEALSQPGEFADRECVEQAARFSASFRRLPRIDGAERAPSGQAKCRSCKAPIERGTWRIRIVYFEEGRFSPGGFLHLACRNAYFERPDVLAPLLHFSPALDEAARGELIQACQS
jgi:hypothetical protein